MKTFVAETQEANKENDHPKDGTGAIILPPPFAPAALLEVPTRNAPVMWTEPGPPAPLYVYSNSKLERIFSNF